MSDIVERLRNWRTVHLARLHLLMEEAADEIERLSRTGSDLRQTFDNAEECHSLGVKTPERECLTAAEREAVEFAMHRCDGPVFRTLRSLLERLA